MKDLGSVTADLRQLEEELVSPSTRHDAVRLRQLLAADFEEVGSSGRTFGREEIVALLQREDPAEDVITLNHFRAQWLANDLVQVRYQSRRSSAAVDHDSERTSLWRHSGEGWTLIYHQGTPVRSR